LAVHPQRAVPPFSAGHCRPLSQEVRARPPARPTARPGRSWKGRPAGRRRSGSRGSNPIRPDRPCGRMVCPGVGCLAFGECCLTRLGRHCSDAGGEASRTAGRGGAGNGVGAGGRALTAAAEPLRWAETLCLEWRGGGAWAGRRLTGRCVEVWATGRGASPHHPVPQTPPPASTPPQPSLFHSPPPHASREAGPSPQPPLTSTSSSPLLAPYFHLAIPQQATGLRFDASCPEAPAVGCM
jgi:hypothetical protein